MPLSISIALGIFLGLSALFLFVMFLPFILQKIESHQYWREAKRHNKRALALRLERKDWKGIPLPTGKSGDLLITKEMMAQLPAMTNRQLDKIMSDRARDLGVDILTTENFYTQSISVTWRPHKKVKK